MSAIGGDITLPDETVTDRREIDLGGRALLLEAHPTAHTDNDLTVRDIGHRQLVDGRSGVSGRRPPRSTARCSAGWRCSTRWASVPPRASCPVTAPLRCPGPRRAAPTRDYLAALVAETRAALDRGESLSEASRHIGADLRGDWLLFDDFNARNATAVYRELEWE